MVDGLCAAAIANLQVKVNGLAADQLEDVITFLSSDLEGDNAISTQMEVELNWGLLTASRKQELDKLLDNMLSP